MGALCECVEAERLCQVVKHPVPQLGELGSVRTRQKLLAVLGLASCTVGRGDKSSGSACGGGCAMGARTVEVASSHLPMVSHPRAVVDLIEAAAAVKSPTTVGSIS